MLVLIILKGVSVIETAIPIPDDLKENSSDDKLLSAVLYKPVASAVKQCERNRGDTKNVSSNAIPAYAANKVKPKFSIQSLQVQRPSFSAQNRLPCRVCEKFGQ